MMNPENPWPRLSDLEAEADFAEMAGDQEEKLPRWISFFLLLAGAIGLGLVIAAIAGVALW
jgi:hypothetical protein